MLDATTNDDESASAHVSGGEGIGVATGGPGEVEVVSAPDRPPTQASTRDMQRFNAFAAFYVGDRHNKESYLEQQREAVAYQVLLRLVVKIKRWKKQRRRAGTGGLMAHFEGVAWSSMSLVMRGVEIMAALCDSSVR